MPPPPLIPVLAGPTASGKTALALRLADAFPLEIISADAMMVYREMDIGTAKPSPEERSRVPHHLIDVVAPDEPFHVAAFVTLAEAAVEAVLARGALPLVVGGTGFYIRALTQGLPTVPAADPVVQRPLWRRFEREGLGGLERELAQRSPEDAARAQRNPRRVVRALEIWSRTGRSPTDFPPLTPRFTYSKRVLLPDAQAHAQAVARRTEAMFRAGLVAEVAALLSRYPTATTALQAIGYKEVRELLAGRATLTETKAQVTAATLRYAKRQRTWFRKEPGAQVQAISRDADARDADAPLEVTAALTAWLRGVWLQSLRR